jgi:hypothetical protein
MENSNDIIENRTRDLPVCSAVPQPTAPPRATDITMHNSRNDVIKQTMYVTRSLLEDTRINP